MCVDCLQRWTSGGLKKYFVFYYFYYLKKEDILTGSHNEDLTDRFRSLKVLRVQGSRPKASWFIMGKIQIQAVGLLVVSELF